MNKMTIAKFEELIADSPLKFASLELVPIKNLRRFHNRFTREFTTSIVRCRLVKCETENSTSINLLATPMQQGSDFSRDREFERELLAHPALAGGTLRFVRRIPARHSEVLEYCFFAPDRMKSIIVKRQVPGAKAEQVTLEEFSNLEKVRTLLGFTLGQSVPEPLLVLPKQGILVTGKVSGVPLTAILKKYANRFSGPFRTFAVRATARRVGMWLRSFQDATRGEPVTYSADSHLADLEVRLAQCHEKGIEPSLTREIFQRIALRSAALNGRLISSAARHGDFTAQNILVKDDQIAVVDFEGFCERDSAYDDLGRFLAYLFVLSARPPYSPRSINAAHQGFLAGFLAGDRIDETLLNIHMLKGAVRIIADGPPQTGSWSRLGTAWMLARRLEDLASGRWFSSL